MSGSDPTEDATEKRLRLRSGPAASVVALEVVLADRKHRRAGQVPDARVKAILNAAKNAGVDMLDTAAAYGDAESIIARASADLERSFLIVSKTPPGAGIDAVIAAVRRSAELAGGNGLDTILVHHPKDLAGHAGDRLWRALYDLTDEGAARRIGLSAGFDDNPKELADHAYSLYELFRPDIPAGKKGWGAKGDLDLALIEGLGKER